MSQRKFLAIFLGLFIISSTAALPSSAAVLPENLPDVSQAPYHVQVIENGNYIAYVSPLYTTYGNPSDYTVSANNGIGKLTLVTTQGTFGCTGTLLDDHEHVLTAAHCISDSSGNNILTGGNISLYDGTQNITSDILSSVKHPDYDGKFTKGNDVAVLTIQKVSDGINTHGINANDSSLIDYTFDKYGYGLSGTGNTGTDSKNYPFGIERNVKNTYDAYGDMMMAALGETYVPHSVLQYDFDNGNPDNDAFGFFFGKTNYDTNSGEEGLSAPGDSGGSTIDSNGNIVGITSYGITLTYRNGDTSDITKQGRNAKLDSSFGEFAADTNVAHYSDWIQAQLDGSTSTPAGGGTQSGSEATDAYVSYSNNKGVVKVTIDLRDAGNNPVPNTSVTIIFASSTASSGSTTKSTGDSGTVTWSFKGVPGGDYTTTVTDVDGKPWIGTTHDDGFHK